MPTFKTKMSKSAWVLIALLVIAIIAIPIIHFAVTPILDPVGAVFHDVMVWASESALNGILFTGGVFLGGVLTWYALKKYIIGTEVPVAGTYAPIGQTISSQPQQKEETVVSN